MKINFDITNAALWIGEDNPEKVESFKRSEIARILRNMAHIIENGNNDGKVYDISGEPVGKWKLED